MLDTNRRWLLADHPVAGYDHSLFRRSDVDLPQPDLAEGQVMLRYSTFLCAPAMRLWMDRTPHGGHPHMRVDEPVFAPAGGRVVASAHPDHPVGQRVSTRGSWQDFEVVDPADRPLRLVPDGVSIADAMGAVGPNALTAYFGVTEVAKPRAGQTMVVSGAAGSTGGTAAQVGKVLGARVVGIAGGSDKCRLLTEELGLDGGVDYKDPDFRARLAAACPDGVDVFYDNVGGEVLDAVVALMNRHGRIALCGQISGYDSAGTVPGLSNMMRLVYGSITVQGFLVSDYESEVPRARAQLKEWLDAGLMRQRVDLHEGFELLPDALGKLYTGANRGTTLVTVDADADATS